MAGRFPVCELPSPLGAVSRLAKFIYQPALTCTQRPPPSCPKARPGWKVRGPLGQVNWSQHFPWTPEVPALFEGSAGMPSGRRGCEASLVALSGEWCSDAAPGTPSLQVGAVRSGWRRILATCPWDLPSPLRRPQDPMSLGLSSSSCFWGFDHWVRVGNTGRVVFSLIN